MDLLIAVTAILTATVAAGLVGVLRGPTPADRILAAQLLGTGGVAVLLLLAEAGGGRALQDVALVLVLLAAMATAVFVRRAGADDRA